MFKVFQYCHLRKVQFQLLACFIWSVNCSSHFFGLFCRVFDFRVVQKLQHQFILETFQYCYLQKVIFVLFVPIQTFFWSVNFLSLIYKLYLLFYIYILYLWAVLILDVFSSEILRIVTFNSQLLLNWFFLVYRLYKLDQDIIFWTKAMFYLRVFSIQFFKNYKPFIKT